jgi:arylsulfatase A-like enzyme
VAHLLRIPVPVLLAALLGSPAGAAEPAARKPNVLLVTIDTLRPDALGWVSGANETPVLDALAKEGVRFRAAVAPVPLTGPSHAALLTGRLPRKLGVRLNGQPLPPGIATLAERLGGAGWETAAFVSGFPLVGSLGLGRGFGRYDDSLPDGPDGRKERRARATAAAASAWIAGTKGPFFAWVHFYDAHAPYEPPPSFARPGPRGAYDGEVAYVDYHVGRLLAAAKARGDLLVVVAGDHGEGLDEHGERTHGFFVYDSTVLVPLVFSWPGRLVPAQPAASPRLLDVAPTLLSLLGLEPLPRIDGVDLVPLLSGRPQAVPPAYLESQLPWADYGFAPLAALRTGGWKVIQAPRPELYRLSDDPGESRNRVREPEHRKQLLSLKAALDGAEQEPEAEETAAVDSETRERLRSLGYLSTTRPRGSPPPGLPDPKDKAALFGTYTRIEELEASGRLSEALGELTRAVAEDPRSRFGLSRLGVLLLRTGQTARAAEILRQAVALDPERGDLRFALADALTRSGRAAAALPEWFEAARLEPSRAEAWSNLGAALRAAGRQKDAVAAYRRAVELRPGEAVFRENLVLALRAAGDEAGARAVEAAGH